MIYSFGLYDTNVIILAGHFIATIVKYTLLYDTIDINGTISLIIQANKIAVFLFVQAKSERPSRRLTRHYELLVSLYT